MTGHVIVDVEGTSLSLDDITLLQRPEVAGVILFSRNAQSHHQVMDLCAAIKSVNPQLVIGVDQEGGRVQRLREGFSRLPPMKMFSKFWQSNPADATFWAKEVGFLMASECRAAGVDISFAPVLDIARVDLPSQVIGDRSFGSHVEQVIALSGAFLQGMQEAGMPGVGKHFPGHGGVKEDSHFELPKDVRSLSEVLAEDAQPFQKLALLGIMPAHIVFSEVDSTYPVGFSEIWLRKILKNQLGFSGLIFSDDLSMAGAASAGSYARRAELAITAGCDLLLVCNNRKGAWEVIKHLEGRLLPKAKAEQWAACLSSFSSHLVDAQRLTRAKKWCETV